MGTRLFYKNGKPHERALHFFLLFITFLTPFVCGISSPYSSDSRCLEKRLKVLHLTFHKGCLQEFNGVAQALNLDLETWYIPELPGTFLDGVSRGNVLYNMGHERAENIWNRHKAVFAQFDAILTSDTASLARIFLQNGFQKPLIIWICNRFDYSDQASIDCDFPDQEFYDLFAKACAQPNVTVIAYTAFEHYYAQKRGLDTGSLLITPCNPFKASSEVTSSAIASKIDKASTFFLPPYHNERIFMNLSQFCEELGIPTYCGRYQRAMDLKDFKGIIHLPYSWSNLAFFENIALGIPYFIPSIDFFKKLAKQNNYFHPNLATLLQDQLFELSEWYKPERKEIIIYFDSWEDLKRKVNETDYEVQRQKIQEYAAEYRLKTLKQWKDVFEKIKDQ